jgi:DNA-directed RNA polymerase II subunit RPB1
MFPVPPMAVRPTVAFGSDKSEDDLTMKLLDIVKANEMLKKCMQQGAGSHICDELTHLLQYHIYTICDNGIKSLPQATTKSKKPIVSIRERLKGKEGRLRGEISLYEGC